MLIYSISSDILDETAVSFLRLRKNDNIHFVKYCKKKKSCNALWLTIYTSYTYLIYNKTSIRCRNTRTYTLHLALPLLSFHSPLWYHAPRQQPVMQWSVHAKRMARPRARANVRSRNRATVTAQGVGNGNVKEHREWHGGLVSFGNAVLIGQELHSKAS